MWELTDFDEERGPFAFLSAPQRMKFLEVVTGLQYFPGSRAMEDKRAAAFAPTSCC